MQNDVAYPTLFHLWRNDVNESDKTTTSTIFI